MLVFNRRAWPKILEQQETFLGNQLWRRLCFDVFASPTSRERVLGEEFELAFDDGRVSREQVAQAIAELEKAGFLVEKPEVPALVSATDRLRSIIRMTRSMGNDFSAISESAKSDVHAELDRALARAQELLTSARHELRKTGEANMERQLAQLPPPANPEALKLHLGCGWDRPDGWINIDFDAELSLNLAWRLPFKSGTVRSIYLAHLFEHLDRWTEAPRLLAEIYRVSAPGGAVRIVVPDIEAFARAYTSDNKAFFDDFRSARPNLVGSTALELVLLYAGAGREPTDWGSHKFGYDFESMKALLERTGFRDVTKSSFRESAYEDFRDIDRHREPAGREHAGIPNSLFVEAKR